MEDSTPKNDTMIKDASVEQIEHYPPDLEQNGKTHGAQNIDSLGYASNAREEDSSDYVSKKTWVVITILSFVYGLAWWPIPITIVTQSYVATSLGHPEASYWFVAIFVAMVSIGFLIAGANSDLFGRRITLIIGEGGLGVGLIISASAKTPTQFEAGLGIAGFFSGVCFMILCSIPELMPLKYRHIGLGIADAMGFVTVVAGPIAGRTALVNGGDTWRWLYWVDVILIFVTLALMTWLYHPPKHPKGVPWYDALRGFDLVGVLLGSAGLALVLTGIIYTSFTPVRDLRVVITLSLGFPTLVVFGLWEAFSNTKYKLCPPTIFKANWGRDFTFPWIVATIISMYYFGINVIYLTMVTELWITEDTPLSEQLILITPGNLGLCVGVSILAAFGNYFSKLIGFRWSVMTSTGMMLITGGILCLVTPFNKGLMIAFVTLQQVFYAYSVIAAIALILWGVHQHDLGIATGLAGTGRNVGGSLAQAIYTTILVNTQARHAAATLPAAAIDAGLSTAAADQLLQVWALGPAAREAIPGVTSEVLAAADLAWRWSYANGLRMVGLASLGFGLTGFLLLFLCADPEPKMTNQIQTFLENDSQAEKNEFH